MAALAAATLWVGLAACTGTEPPVVSQVVGDSADQIMFGVDHIVTVDGVMRARLVADTGYLYEGSQTWELRGVTVHFFSSEGKETSTIVSREATYDLRTKNMEARGEVVGTTPDGRRLETSILRFQNATDDIVGDSAFVFTGPDENMRGNSFIADPDFTRVRATNFRGRPGRLEGRN